MRSPANSLPSARQGKTFPAIVRGITRKLLILQELLPEIEKFSLLFPVGREKSGASERCRRSNKAGLPTAVPRRSSFVLRPQPRHRRDRVLELHLQSVPDAWLAHTSPLSWEHISFSGDFQRERAAATADKAAPAISARRKSLHDLRGASPLAREGIKAPPAFNWARTQNNFGNALLALGERETPARRLSKMRCGGA